MALNDDIAHMARIDLSEQIGIGNLCRGLMGSSGLKQIEKYNQEQGDNHPKRKVATKIAHSVHPLARRFVRGETLRQRRNPAPLGTPDPACFKIGCPMPLCSPIPWQTEIFPPRQEQGGKAPPAWPDRRQHQDNRDAAPLPTPICTKLPVRSA